MTHLSLGLGDRDQVRTSLGGSIPAGSLVVITGGTGTGKSVWTSRLAYGFLSEGHDVGMVSTEMPARSYIDQMASLSYDVVDALLEDRLRYFHAPTHQDRSLIRPLVRPSLLWDGDVVCVDAFSALLAADPDLVHAFDAGEAAAATRRVLARLAAARSDGTVLLVTVHPDAVPEAVYRTITSAADVYFELQTTEVGQSLRRSLVIRRFLEMPEPVDDTVGFSVEQGRGIVIESRTIA